MKEEIIRGEYNGYICDKEIEKRPPVGHKGISQIKKKMECIWGNNSGGGE